MEELERCLHQVFKTEKMPLFLIESRRARGAGNCNTCQYNSIENKDCSDYSLFKMIVLDEFD